jgi:hypothetical protein
LYDCGCDSHVLSDIKKQHNSLTNNGYEKILGLRDLYPKPLENRTKVENGIKGFLKTGSSVCVMQWTGVIRDGTLI